METNPYNSPQTPPEKKPAVCANQAGPTPGDEYIFWMVVGSVVVLAMLCAVPALAFAWHALAQRMVN